MSFFYLKRENGGGGSPLVSLKMKNSKVRG